MSTQSTTNDIRTALSAAAADDFPELATALLGTLGYRSERTLTGQTGKPADFIQQFPAQNPGTQWERSFLDNAQSVRILFQFTGSEIQAQTQQGLFAAIDFDTGNARSFLFAAVELNGNSYPRGQYAAFTRELNKHIRLPMVVLFRTADNRITLAFVHRRPNKRDPNRDVLGSVSLIREIDPESPHRAHLDILAELSLPERLRWMDSHGKTHNFDGLLDAWLDALDTEELNRRFYRDLFGWFERAVQAARFPKGQAQTLSSEEHVIQLITRLLFVWFIKEKGLVSENLFVEHQVGGLLRDYDPGDGDSYYRAVLQNLFFATLNTEIGHRGFSSGDNSTHRDFSRYRYADQIADPGALLELFANTPFINGGLFDCLDSEAATGDGGYRIDCFTDNRAHRRDYSIPNWLFFDRDEKGPGLITLFNRYKFTVEENTPAEQEVALDPELLGKVFENLLAAYNPETRETARKQTGSYYTPRAVVDYMVDEALVAALSQKVSPAADDRDFWQERMRYLLDYGDDFTDAEDLFTPEERESIVRGIAGTKVLDPGVGSGAFPMGVLHKLTLALRRLDPGNELWEELQKELARQRAAAAFDTSERQERDAELQEISDTFERYRDTDFGRKLYLVQNSIYGVDIQPVAIQIAKLRFFISLAIDQEPDPAAANYGIKPLPNLETRFVAANTLLGLGGLNRELTSERTRELQRRLNVNRERHFHAASRQMKLKYRAEDRELRKELAQSLTDSGLDAIHAAKVAAWDPYDQNASANWFDAGYMFGVSGGFDVVIGNPPYVVIKDQQLRELYKEGVYGRMNTYGLFIQRGLQLACANGQLTFINPRTLLTDRYFTNLRKVIRQSSQLKSVVLISDRHNTFESVLQECIILHLDRKATSPKAYMVGTRSISRPGDLTDPQSLSLISSERVLLGNEYDGAFYIGTSEFDYQVFEKMNAIGVKLAAWALKAETGKIQFDKYQEYVQTNNANGACRLVWAENVQRYALAPTARRAGKEWLKKSITGVISPSITGAGIVTQRTTANEQPRRIIATLLTPKSVGSNQVYSENGTNFIPLGTDNHRAAFLVAALNSSLVEFLFRRLNSNVHVSAGELNALPFPPLPDDQMLVEIESLVSDLLDWNGVECTLGNFDRAVEHEHRLDLLIGSLYGFSEDEVAQIQATMPSHKFVYDPVPE